MNGTNVFSMTVCAGSQTCFTINSGDGDAVQNTYIDWDHSIPGGILTTLPGHRETATFCWTPTQADISPNPHCFTVVVTCLLYTSDAADERSSVDLGGRRIIKKQTHVEIRADIGHVCNNSQQKIRITLQQH